MPREWHFRAPRLLRAAIDDPVRVVDSGQLVALEFVDGGFGDGCAKALDHWIRNCFWRPVRQLTRGPLNGEAGSLFDAVDRAVGPPPLQLIDRSVGTACLVRKHRESGFTFGLPYQCLEHKKEPAAPNAPPDFQTIVSEFTPRRSETISAAPGPTRLRPPPTA